MIALKSYLAKSFQGNHLNFNEDKVDIDFINKLFIIMDGFGGSNIGDKATNDVCENIKKYYTHFGGDANTTMPFFFSSKYLLEANALINAIYQSHNILIENNNSKAISERAGVSCVAATFADDIMVLISIGSCKSLLYRDGALKEICMPDNYELLANNNECRHLQTFPLSAIGLFEDLYFESREIRVRNDDLFIFLTDGVYSRLRNDELLEIIHSNKTLPLIADFMIDSANSNGNLDNQSVILLKF